jgi:hypothetical protein
MKRTLLTLMCSTLFGMALAGPPADFQLVCGDDPDALVGVAMLVDDELRVSLIDGALDACTEGVYGVSDGATLFTVHFTLLDGVVDDVEVMFVEESAVVPSTSFAELPEVAIEGKLRAQQNREAALGRATQARERANERRGGPPMDVPVGDDDDGDLEDDATESEEDPAPAARGRR